MWQLFKQLLAVSQVEMKITSVRGVTVFSRVLSVDPKEMWDWKQLRIVTS